LYKFHSSQHEAVADFTSCIFVGNQSELIQTFKVNLLKKIKNILLQALKLNIKSFNCSVDPEYAKIKTCFVKSLEHDTYDVDMNIVFIKEVKKLKVRLDNKKVAGQNTYAY
jgi:hypothetical protein